MRTRLSHSVRTNTQATSPVTKAVCLQAHHTQDVFRWGTELLTALATVALLTVRLTNQESETPRMPSIARVSNLHGMCSVGTINTNLGKA